MHITGKSVEDPLDFDVGYFNDANDIGRSTLIATGLALFVITLLVNLAARAIIARRKEFSGAN